MLAIAAIVVPPAAGAGRGLRVSGRSFLAADGSRFAWRGVTAFRLVEMTAHGREGDAERYLAWATSKGLNVVRVLAMADTLFTLSAADGRAALPTFLRMAERHGLYVEVVALADTALRSIDMPAHVRAIGAICAKQRNCVIEIANEPTHPTQARALHGPAYVRSLARLIPTGIPVSLGSVESGAAYGAGTYVTWHPPRDDHVARLDEGAQLLARYRKPVICDEPIGAAAAAIPGRRDNDPERFRQAAAKLKRLGLGATFHYEGGLHAMIPTGVELACLEAWLEGLR